MPTDDDFTIFENDEKTTPVGSDLIELQETGGVSGLSKKSTLTNCSLGLGLASASKQGAMSAADFTKLGGIESAATADQSDAEIKTAYENNSDTNEYSDAEQTKLAGIETSADVNDLVLLSSQTPSAVASVDFATLLSSTYSSYLIVLANVIPASDGTDLQLRLADSASTWITANYRYRGREFLFGGTDASFNSASAAAIVLAQDVGAGTNEIGVSGTIEIFNPIASSRTALNWQVQAFQATANANVGTSGYGEQFGVLTMESVQILFPSVNIASGEIRLYGRL